MTDQIFHKLLDRLTHPELPNIEVFLKRITPELAADILVSNTSGQRTLSPDTVDRYSSDMSCDEWMFTGAPILIDDHGRLIDGQHRLNAIRDSGQSQILLVITGLDPETIAAVDSGRRRSYGDYLKMTFQYPQHSQAAAIVRAWWFWANGNYGDRGIARVPVPNYLHALPTTAQLETSRLAMEEELEVTTSAAVRLGATAAGRFPAVTITSWGLIWLVLTSYDVELREAFFHELKEAKSTRADYPINALSNRLGRERESLPRTQQLHLVFTAFNAWRQGQALATLRKAPEPISWSTLAVPPAKKED